MATDADLAAAASRAVDDAVFGLAGAATRAVVLFATATYSDPRPLVAAARRAARGARLVGCAASGVLAGIREAEDGDAVAAMAISGDELEPFLTGAPATLGRHASRGGLALLF